MTTSLGGSVRHVEEDTLGNALIIARALVATLDADPDTVRSVMALPDCVVIETYVLDADGNKQQRHGKPLVSLELVRVHS